MCPKRPPVLNRQTRTTSVWTRHLTPLIARRSRQGVRDSQDLSKSTHVNGIGVVQAGAVSAACSKSVWYRARTRTILSSNAFGLSRIAQ